MSALKDLQPTVIAGQPDLGFPALIENLIIRIFMEPRIKEHVGWIGAAYRIASSQSWTIRIRGKKGVYCVRYLGHEREGSHWLHGLFNVHYFPSFDENILDTYSIGENLLRLDPSFEKWVRQSPDGADPLETQFVLGRFILTIDRDEKNVFFSLVAPRRWREIQRDGLAITNEDSKNVEAIPPGGIDRNIPAFALSFRLFNKLVLTYSYLSKETPKYVVLKAGRIPIWEITGGHKYYPSESEFNKIYLLSVGFGPHSRKKKMDMLLGWVLRYFPYGGLTSSIQEQQIIWLTTPLTKDSPKGTRLWWEAHKWSEGDKPGISRSGLLNYRPPLFIVTGFLGSGKTTLINHIVEYKTTQANKFIAVIQNEVGQTEVDSRLINSAFHITNLEEGCVCCTLLGEMRQAIRKICIDYVPDAIILETTGVADPTGILEEIPTLEPFVRFDSFITVVDGAHLKILKSYAVALSQIEHADLIILNKTDLMDAESIEVAKRFIQTLNHHAPILLNAYASINPNIFSVVDDEIDLPVSGHVCGTNGMISKYPCHNYPGHHLDLASQSIQTFSIHFTENLNERLFIEFLNVLPKAVYRVKGVVALEGREKPHLLQFVGGRYELTDFAGEYPAESNNLVFIGQEMDKDNIRLLFSACLIKH